MSARTAVWVAVILASGALVAWIARNTYWEEISIPQPPRGEVLTNPFYSAQHLAQSLGAQAHWQRVLGSMPPANGIVVASAWHWGLMRERRERLERWVASGGRLIIDRSVMGGQREIQNWAGISRVERNDEGNQDSGAREKNDECPLIRGPQQTGGPLSQFAVCGLEGLSSLRVARRASWLLRDERHDIQVLRVPIGLGSVTVINARPFGNLALLQGDHARLFVAATQLRRGDQLWFLTEERGASLLSLVWTTGAPAVATALVLIALWLWRTGVRFGPPVAPTDPARRSLAEQIRGTGNFTVRFGGGRALHAAAVRALTETAARQIPGYTRLPDQERVVRMARLAGVEPDTLAWAMNYSTEHHTGGRRITQLRHCLTQLESVRRSISVGALKP